MKHLALVAVTLAAVLAPAARAQDAWPDDRGEDGGWYDSRDDGYDVSVDLDAQGSMDPSEFQQPLAPYGDWVTVGSYGSVWRPRVATGWRPYYYGRWEWTTEGWLWVSDEPFGWATYHYGRWAWERGYGWIWVPGTQWAPAWVSWRYSGDVVGWAPLAPGLSLYVTDFAFVDFWWTFVPTVRFCSTPIYRIAYAPHFSRRWWDATRPAPPRPAPHGGSWAGGRPRPAGPAWGGPSSRFVEERAGRPIRPSRIVPAASAGEHRARPGEISVFRPEARPRPARGDDRRSAPAIDGSRGRGWDGGRPSTPGRAVPAPSQPRREDRGLDRGPGPSRSDDRGGGRSGSRGWDGRCAPGAARRGPGLRPGRPRLGPPGRPVTSQRPGAVLRAGPPVHAGSQRGATAPAVRAFARLLAAARRRRRRQPRRRPLGPPFGAGRRGPRR